MQNRGISGFGAILIIIILILSGYAGYQYFRPNFTYNAFKEKVKDAVELGPVQPDQAIIDNLLKEASEIKLGLTRDNIWIDHSIPDSFRIYVEYDDSINILGLFSSCRHYKIDQIAEIKVHY